MIKLLTEQEALARICEAIGRETNGATAASLQRLKTRLQQAGTPTAIAYAIYSIQQTLELIYAH